MVSKHQRRIELLLELAICVGIPTGATSLCKYFWTFTTRYSDYVKDYIVQAARYDIFEELGCLPAEAFSGLSIILIDAWTVIFPFISLVFYTRK